METSQCRGRPELHLSAAFSDELQSSGRGRWDFGTLQGLCLHQHQVIA